VPQGSLTQTHFARVARLIKYIEPRLRTSFAFAIGNLSRDDIQHEPGHGGLALIFGLRVEASSTTPAATPRCCARCFSRDRSSKAGRSMRRG